MTAAITARGVAKQFRGEPILAGLDLEVRPSEIVALVGPSGCGKSTLLRLIAGLERDHAGELGVAGRAVDGPSRGVGVVFQEPRLLPWLSVRDNIALANASAPVDGRGLPSSVSAAEWQRGVVDDLLAQVQLAHAADALPRQLSGGMAQRAALARALAAAPSVLLLDEPFSAVDALTRVALQDLVLDLWRRTRITILLVTHDLDEALHLADRIVVLAGRPARVRHERAITAARPRDRRDPALAHHRAALLDELGAEPRAATRGAS